MWESRQDPPSLLTDLPRSFLISVYRFLDPPIHPVALSVDDPGLVPIYDMTEGDGVIRDCRPAPSRGQ